MGAGADSLTNSKILRLSHIIDNRQTSQMLKRGTPKAEQIKTETRRNLRAVRRRELITDQATFITLHRDSGSAWCPQYPSTISQIMLLNG